MSSQVPATFAMGKIANGQMMKEEQYLGQILILVMAPFQLLYDIIPTKVME